MINVTKGEKMKNQPLTNNQIALARKLLGKTAQGYKYKMKNGKTMFQLGKTESGPISMFFIAGRGTSWAECLRRSKERKDAGII